jgi:hypothetical protein
MLAMLRQELGCGDEHRAGQAGFSELVVIIAYCTPADAPDAHPVPCSPDGCLPS